MSWLVYVHPIAMVGILALGVFVLRDGLAIRRARFGGPAANLARHLRLAKVFAVLMIVGFGGGLVSQAWLRGNEVFESVHSVFASGALIGIGGAACAGLWMERRGGSPQLRNAHAVLGSVGLLMGLAAAVAGFAILP